MQAAVMDRLTKTVSEASTRLEAVLPEQLKEHSTTLVYVAGGSVAALTLRAVLRKYYRSNPFKFGRTGALAKDEIGSSIDDYERFFDQKDGRGVQANQVAGKAKSNTPEFVDKFYRRVWSSHGAGRHASGPERHTRLPAPGGGAAGAGARLPVAYDSVQRLAPRTRACAPPAARQGPTASGSHRRHLEGPHRGAGRPQCLRTAGRRHCMHLWMPAQRHSSPVLAWPPAAGAHPCLPLVPAFSPAQPHHRLLRVRLGPVLPLRAQEPGRELRRACPGVQGGQAVPMCACRPPCFTRAVLLAPPL